MGGMTQRKKLCSDVMANSKPTLYLDFQCKISPELASQVVAEREKRSHKKNQKWRAKSRSVNLMAQSRAHQSEGTQAVV